MFHSNLDCIFGGFRGMDQELPGLHDEADLKPEFFVSRAGPDAGAAQRIAHILEDAGRRVLIQDWDFKNRAFMERMHAASSKASPIWIIRMPGSRGIIWRAFGARQPRTFRGTAFAPAAPASRASIAAGARVMCLCNCAWPLASKLHLTSCLL
jgi:hypothetical protein